MLPTFKGQQGGNCPTDILRSFVGAFVSSMFMWCFPTATKITLHDLSLTPHVARRTQASLSMLWTTLDNYF